MSSDNQCLRFSIEESVWFQKGQEVRELVSISLDPDIVIQEHAQYVSIRGALKLSGEYRIEEDVSPDETRDFTSARLVNEILTREDGISELNHRFPVDITIPKYRVESLEDVYVAVEAFDYELPKRGCMQIAAELSISGILGLDGGVSTQTKEPTHTEQINEREEEAIEVNAKVDEPAEKGLDAIEVNAVVNESPKEEQAVLEVSAQVFEAEQEEREEEAIEVNAKVDEPAEEGLDAIEVNAVVDESAQEEQEALEVNAQVFESEQEEQEEALVRNGLVDNVQEISEGEVVQQGIEEAVLHTEESSEKNDELLTDDDLFIPFEVEARKEAYQEQVDEIMLEETKEYEEIIRTPQIEVKPRQEKIFVFGSKENRGEAITAVEEKNDSTKAPTDTTKAAKRDENELYLTKIFTRDEEEELSKMKICIVQNGDSLDRIAERYEISVQQLVRANSMSTDQNVSEGQLLYIPAHVNS